MLFFTSLITSLCLVSANLYQYQGDRKGCKFGSCYGFNRFVSIDYNGYDAGGDYFDGEWAQHSNKDNWYFESWDRFLNGKSNQKKGDDSQKDSQHSNGGSSQKQSTAEDKKSTKQSQSETSSGQQSHDDDSNFFENLQFPYFGGRQAKGKTVKFRSSAKCANGMCEKDLFECVGEECKYLKHSQKINSGETSSMTFSSSASCDWGDEKDCFSDSDMQFDK